MFFRRAQGSKHQGRFVSTREGMQPLHLSLPVEIVQGHNRVLFLPFSEGARVWQKESGRCPVPDDRAPGG